MKKCYINTISAIHPDGLVGDDVNMLHACEPDYKDIIVNANQRRRMSRIVKMGVACGLDCLARNKESKIDAIITATGLGCLADTEKFLNIILENNEELLNPTAFIQSTFNTIGAQIALISNNHSYNNTYVHRGLSFESALIDGMMRISEGDENVLIGAADEVTGSSYKIMKRMGLLQNVVMGEGAQFFILGREGNSSSYAELKSVRTFIGQLGSDQIKDKIHSFLKDSNIESSQIDVLMTGKNGHKKQDLIYDDTENIFPQASHMTFKDSCGEYHTASSFALWKASIKLKENSSVRNILIYNHYNKINHSLILLSKC